MNDNEVEKAIDIYLEHLKSKLDINAYTKEQWQDSAVWMIFVGAKVAFGISLKNDEAEPTIFKIKNSQTTRAEKMLESFLSEMFGASRTPLMFIVDKRPSDLPN